MSMNPQDMSDSIKSAFDNLTNSIAWENGERPEELAYTNAFDKALTEYIESNMEITYTWAAKTPSTSPASDPVTSFKSELVISDKTIGQPSNLSSWGSLVIDCFQKATVKHPSGFEVKAGSLLMKTLAINPPPVQYPGPLLGICTQIYNWLLTCINPDPLSGKHGSYVGATTGMAIA
jgi:hypothetical protein